MELAHEHHIPTSEFNAWDPVDRDHALGLKQLRDESCSGCGIHPTQQQLYVAKWKHCRVCELLAQARDAGPPSDDKGWHLTLQHT